MYHEINFLYFGTYGKCQKNLKKFICAPQNDSGGHGLAVLIVVSKVFAVDDESFSLDLDLSVRYGWS